MLGAQMEKAKNAAPELRINKNCGPTGLKCVYAQLNRHDAIIKPLQIDCDLFALAERTEQNGNCLPQTLEHPSSFHSYHSS